MKYADSSKLLKRSGFVFEKEAKGCHEIWRHPNGRTILISRNGSHDYRAMRNLRSQVRKLISDVQNISDASG